MRTRLFTTGIVVRNGRLLVLKRKDDDDTYPGLWDPVGGHFKDGESAEDCMTREALEETGLSVTVKKVGRLIEYRDGYGRSLTVPFLLHPYPGAVRLSEHSTFMWVTPRDSRRLSAVPSLTLAATGFGL